MRRKGSAHDEAQEPVVPLTCANAIVDVS